MVKIFGFVLVFCSSSVSAFATSSATALELKDSYDCYADKSIVKRIFEGLTHVATVDGKKGYYTPAHLFRIEKNKDGSFHYDFEGEQAFCQPDEQCAGPYSILSGNTGVVVEGSKIRNTRNLSVSFEIDTHSGRCTANIHDFRINPKLKKFEGRI